ncbi:Subtilase-type proteinase psp3, partial [Diplonema papillatum]
MAGPSGVALWVLLLPLSSLLGVTGAAPRSVHTLETGESVVPNEYLLFIDEDISDEELEWIFPVTSKDPVVAGSSQNGGFGAKQAIRTKKKRVVVVNIDISGVERLQEIYPGLVSEVQPNAIVYGAASSQLTCPTTESGDDLPYHLRSMYQKPDDMGKSFAYDPTWGEEILAYITDSGADCSHSELAGRCTWLYNAVAGESAEDLHGHGTGVASVMAGKTLGVSRSSQVMVTKCLDANNRGTIAGCTAALVAVADYERNNKTGTTTSLINLSLAVSDSSSSELFRSAIEDLVSLGIIVIAAAGNDISDACDYLPAAVDGVITVGNMGVKAVSSKAEMYVATNSNFGSCVDIHAPGQNVKAARLGYPAGYVFLSGTSFASPGVASMVTAFIATRDEKRTTSAEALNWLVHNSLTGLTGKGLQTGTPDRVAHLPCANTPAVFKTIPKYEENCFGLMNGSTTDPAGAIEWYGTATEPTWRDDIICWQIDCPAGLIAFKITDWRLQEFTYSTDFVYIVNAAGSALKTYKGKAAANVGQTASVSNVAIVRFSSTLRANRAAEYPGFRMTYTCTVSTPSPSAEKKTIYVRVATGASPGDESAQTVTVQYVFSDGTSYSKTFSAGPTHDAAVWTAADAPQGVDTLESVVITTATNGADTWNIASFEVYYPGIGYQALGVGGSSVKSAILSTASPSATFSEAAPPTSAPSTSVPPTEVPPTESPPTEAPPTEVPPTESPPTEAPPTEVPPTEAPETE